MLSVLIFFIFIFFFEILAIFTDVIGALDEIFFSSWYIFAFSAIKDLFFFTSNISTKGNLLSILSFSATVFVITIL